ncbi:MAG TPA: hypothetical protein PL070_21815, partial [Flavobacteriales bacterium]|nr:hypothetical protein [Flavobacteriales bacterium]
GGGGDGGSFNLNEGDSGSGVIYDSASDAVYVCGSYEGSPATFGSGISFSGYGAFLAKYSTDGECLWVRRTSYGAAVSIHLDAIGHVVITGAETNWPPDSMTFYGDPDIQIVTGPFVAKYSTDGDLLWAKSLGRGLAPWASSQGQRSIVYGTARGFGPELFGTGIPLDGALNLGFIASVDSSFSQVDWVHRFISPNRSLLTNHAFVGQGDHLVSGAFADSLFLDSDTLQGPVGQLRPFILRLDSTGVTEQWVMDLGTSVIRAPRISQFTDGTLALAGPFVDSVQVGGQTFQANSATDFLVARIDTDGNLISTVNNGPITTSNMDVVTMSDGGVVLGSTFSGTIDLGNGHVLTGGADIFVAKLGLVTSVPTLKSAASGELFIYANPNNGTCTIELPEALHNETDLVLRILDTQGRVVQQSALRMHEDRVQLDIRAQAKGSYVAEVLSEGVRYTGRIVFE